jgi:hypothetical protein
MVGLKDESEQKRAYGFWNSSFSLYVDSDMGGKFVPQVLWRKSSSLFRTCLLMMALEG